MIKIKKLSFKNLKNLNIQERIEAAKTPGIGQTLMSALTPTQIADLFPRYYLMREPDISGFLKAMPTSMSAARQAQFQEQLNNTASGAAAGSNMESGGWKRKLQQGVNSESATVLKPGQAPAPKLSDAQLEAYTAIKSGPVDINDPKAKMFATLQPEQLKSAGLEKYKDDSGKEFLRYIPTAAAGMSEEEVKKKMGQYRPVYKLSEKDLSDRVVNVIAGEAYTNNQKSVDAVINNMLNRVGTKAYGPSGNLEEVATAPGQYAGKKYADEKTAAYIRERIQAIASGTVPDVTSGSNEYRAGWYSGPWGQKHADAPVIGGNRFAYNPKGGTGTYAPYSEPMPIGDYRKQDIEARRMQLIREEETARVGSLAASSQAQMGLYTEITDGQHHTISKEGYIYSKNPDLRGSSQKSIEQCASLSKAFVPSAGHASEWRVYGAGDPSVIVPGRMVATAAYNDRSGGRTAVEMGGRSYYHTGMALTSPDKDGNFWILDQSLGHPATVKQQNISYKGDMFNKQPNAFGAVKGAEVVSPTSLRVGLEILKNKAKAEPDKYGNVVKQVESNLSSLESANVQAKANPTEVNRIAPSEVKNNISEMRRDSSVATDASGQNGDKPLGAPVEAPHGKHKLGETPAPVPEKKPEPQTIKQFVKGEGYAGIKDVPNPKYVPNTESKDTGVGPKRVDTSVTTDAGQKKPDTAQGTVNPQPHGQQKLDTVPQPVKTNALGGSNRTHTDQITALPIGGIKDDNSVVVDSNQRPLFTMNTNKETAVYDPTERKVDVIPNQKPGQVGRAPEPGNDLQQQLDGLKADILGMNENTQAPAPQDAAKGSVSHISDRDPHMIEQIMDMTRNLFLDPSAARAFSRARFHETGDATNDFHHSSGNSNMQ